MPPHGMSKLRHAPAKLTGLVGLVLAACTAGRPPAGPRETSPPPSARIEPAPEGRDPRCQGGEPTVAAPALRGNTRIASFDDAKRELSRIYGEGRRHIDVYCGCEFAPVRGHGLRVDHASCGYVPAQDEQRAARIEWEHAVPAAVFGRTFVEWREGSRRCVDEHGRRFRGRSCARIASPEFARIEADMHNLFPVVGEVNGLRADLPMGILDPPERGHGRSAPSGTYRFGACGSSISAGVFHPRPEVRGDLARAYKYMDAAYPGRGILDDAHRALFDRWDAEDPPDAWERERNVRIAERQGSANPFIGR